MNSMRWLYGVLPLLIACGGSDDGPSKGSGGSGGGGTGASAGSGASAGTGGAPTSGGDTLAFVGIANDVTLFSSNASDSETRTYQVAQDKAAFSTGFPLALDLDGDGIDMVSSFVSRTGEFMLETDGNLERFDEVVPFAEPSDTFRYIPLGGDVDGDGRDEIGSYDSLTGETRMRFADGTTTTDQATAGRMGFLGDWDGDGTDTLAVIDPDTGYIAFPDGPGGQAIDLPTAASKSHLLAMGDFDGDGRDSFGLLDLTTKVFTYQNELVPSAAQYEIAAPATARFLFPTAGKWGSKPTPPPWSGYDWPTAEPSAEGVDPAQLEVAFGHAEQLPNVFSLLVVRHGKLVAERYFHGGSQSFAPSVKSVSKSFLSALYGIAVARGEITGKEPLSDYFDGLAAEKQSITLGHLLTMTAGLSWKEGNEEWFKTWFASDSWSRFPLEQAVEAAPGTAWVYSTGLTHTAAQTLTKAVGRPLRDYGDEHLFGPLGVRAVRWDYDLEGTYFGGAEMFFVPRDLARFGELYLRDGTLDGKAILLPAWVQESTKSIVPPSMTGGDYGYGAWWWTHSLLGHDMFCAEGHGGQLVCVIKDLDAVVVMTAVPDVDGATSEKYFDYEFALLALDLIPAFKP